MGDSRNTVSPARCQTLLSLGVVCLVFGACGSVTPVATPASMSPTNDNPLPSPTMDIAVCPRTMPTRAPEAVRSMPGWNRAYGNSELWIGGLGEEGVLQFTERMVSAEGYIDWKAAWWRLKPGVLSITGQEVYNELMTILPQVPEGYGLSGFQSTSVRFPGEGCYEVTGTVGDEPLTFTTYVMIVR